MLIPIILRYPLGIQQGILRMGRLRECPACIEITTEPNNDDALANLGHAIVRRIQQTEYHIIRQPIIVSGRVMLFQQSEMFHPGHAVSFYNLRVLKLKEYVIEILAKRLPQQASDIFKDKNFRPYFADSADSFREHISLIIVSLVLSTKREWLAWRPACHKLYFPGITIVMYGAYIRLIYLPIFDGRIPVLNVVVQIIAGILIPFIKSRMIEPGQLKSESETAGPAEEFNRVHHKPFPILSIITTMPS